MVLANRSELLRISPDRMPVIDVKAPPITLALAQRVEGELRIPVVGFL
jgi:hypothetical protein